MQIFIRPSNLITLALGCFAIILALFGMFRNLAAIHPTPRSVDFSAYYVAAAILSQGQGRELYVLETQDRVAQERHVTTVGGGYLYLPFFAALLQPLAQLEFHAAARVWLILNLAALLVCSHLLLKLAHRNSGFISTLLTFGLVLILPPVVSDLIFGQVNIVILLLLTGAFLLLDSNAVSPRRAIHAGFLIGLASALKFYPALVLLPLVLVRQWRVLAGVALAFAMVLGISLMSDHGVENTLHYLALRGPEIHPPVDPFNQSLTSALQRALEARTFHFSIFEPDNMVEMASAPLVHAPMLVIPLWLLFGGIVSGVSLWTVRRIIQRAMPLRLAMALCLTLALLVIPLVWEYYALLLLLPFAVWFSLREHFELTRLVVTSAAFALTLHRYWRVMAFAGVPFWLLSFGLLAIVICWGYTLYLSNEWNTSPLNA